MRTFLSISFAVLALVVSAAGATPAAHAVECGTSSSINQSCTTTNGIAGTCLMGANEVVSCVAGAGNSTGLAPSAASQAAARMQTDYGTKSDDAYNFVMVKIMSLFAWLVGIAALTLDYTVYYTVIKMGDYVNHLSAIGVAWRILRDLGNIMLIFGFLAVGITTILNVDWYGGGKKMLPMMIVAAVFLNFSLFISEAIIDTGNLFATQFFTQINGGTPVTSDFLSNLSTSNEGISNKIMNQLGLQTLYGNGRANPAMFTGGNPWYVGFMGILLFIVTAFVMFSLAFVLIARFVMLVFLIILAPIGFAGLAVPQLAKRAGQWWSKLFEQTVTAPVLLLLLYIALAVITDAQFLVGFGPNPNWTGLIAGGNTNIAGFSSMMLSFLVAMGLLILVVIQSKSLSAVGAAWASQTAGKLTFGATALGMRTTIGLGSNYAAKMLGESKLGGTKTGRILAGGLDRGAKASFDIRGATAFGGLKATGIDAGEAQKGGYRARYEAGIKAHEEYAKSLKGPETTKEQEQQIEKARIVRKNAADAFDKTKEIYRNIEKGIGPKEREIKLLEAEKARNDKFQIKDAASAETERKLTEARSNLELIKKNQNKAREAMQDAEKTAREFEEAEKNVNKNIAAVTTDVGKKFQESYGKSIRDLGIVGSFVLGFGPSGGGQTAARKIIKDATKKEDKLESIKKLLKEEEESDKGKSEGEKGEETEKPREAEKPKPTTP